MKSNEQISDAACWLKTSDAFDILDKAANAVKKSVLARSLSLAYLRKDSVGVYAEKDMIDDIRSELALFILENEKVLSQLQRKDNVNAQGLLKHMFIRHWITNTRNPKSDPRRNLYKHIGDLLRVSDDFFTRITDRKSTAFSMIQESHSIPPLVAEDIQEIPFPNSAVENREYETINRKDILLYLAKYFWEQVRLIWGGKAIWIDIGDFVEWIGMYVSLRGPQMDDSPDLLNQVPSGLEVGEIPDAAFFDMDAIKKWALLFSNRLSDREKSVFELFHGSSRVTLKEMADKLGYKGSSGPKYILVQTEEKLRFFLRDLPWLSPPDIIEEAFSFFFETLLQILKNRTSEPYTECEEPLRF